MNCRPAIEGEDAWDSPFQRRENVSSQIISSLLAEESLITKPYAQQVIRNESVEDDSIPTTEHVINMPFTRDPNEPIGKLSSTIIVSGELSPKRQISSPKPKRILQPTVEEVKEINESSSKTASPKKSHLKIQNPEIMESKESKNLENTITKTEIKKKEPAHPIEELKHLARRLSASEDDPPFNFQGMLRKTNFQRESLKRSVDNIRSRRTSKETNYFNKQKIISEIAPGVFLEGIVIDL